MITMSILMRMYNIQDVYTIYMSLILLYSYI